ncbi:MAG: TetR/AcrR family transcriptional regulator [Chloroflexota bacterium]
MPRLTPAHEQQIRERILEAALRVFGEKGYHGSTIQDVVRESGLSVGAIYTHFRNKEEMFLLTCDQASTRGMDELALRLSGGRTTAERMSIAVALYLETIDAFGPLPGQVTLVHAWAEAESEPRVREMLVRRRERLVGAGQLLLTEGVARGELPRWLDVDAATRAFTALLDGLLLQRIEAGEGWRREDAERHARSMLELLFAAAATERPMLPEALPQAGGEPGGETGSETLERTA